MAKHINYSEEVFRKLLTSAADSILPKGFYNRPSNVDDVIVEEIDANGKVVATTKKEVPKKISYSKVVKDTPESGNSDYPLSLLFAGKQCNAEKAAAAIAQAVLTGQRQTVTDMYIYDVKASLQTTKDFRKASHKITVEIYATTEPASIDRQTPHNNYATKAQAYTSSLSGLSKFDLLPILQQASVLQSLPGDGNYISFRRLSASYAEIVCREEDREIVLCRMQLPRDYELLAVRRRTATEETFADICLAPRLWGTYRQYISFTVQADSFFGQGAFQFCGGLDGSGLSNLDFLVGFKPDAVGMIATKLPLGYILLPQLGLFCVNSIKDIPHSIQPEFCEVLSQILGKKTAISTHRLRAFSPQEIGLRANGMDLTGEGAYVFAYLQDESAALLKNPAPTLDL